MAQIFPRWTNEIPWILPPFALIGAVSLIFGIWFWFAPAHTDVGYMPDQPVAYSHQLHAGDLGIDCRYCHYNVDRSPYAGVPATSVCMNCHANVKADSPKLEKIRESFKNDIPVEWVRIHKLPDYAYFDHSAHVTQGVGCASCHGRVDRMVEVVQEKPLSMGWCLECHRDPVRHIRPLDKLTVMDWEPTGEWLGEASKINKKLEPPTLSCSGCHR